MAITVTTPDDNEHNRGDRREAEFELAFDSSYAFDGETFNPLVLGFDRVDRVIIEGQRGYTFEWDQTNSKIKVLGDMPAVVVEEQQTIASNAITLDFPPAYIMNVAQSNANIAITTSCATLDSNQCQPTAEFAWDTRGGLTFHAGLSGTVYVTYVTQAWWEVWNNLVWEEDGTFTTTYPLTNMACAIQCVNADAGGTTTNACLMLDKDDTAATGEVDIDFLVSTTSTLTFAAADVVTGCVVTYIKKPTSGWLFDHFIEEEAMTAASDICTTVKPIALWGYAGQAPENGATTEVLININGTQGGAEAWTDFHKKVDFHGCTTGTLAYIGADRADIPTVPIQVPNGWDLSGLTAVRVTVIGV